MSAEALRRAASLMRERAEASKTAFGYGPWEVAGLDEYGQYVVVPTEQVGLGSRVAADLTEDDAEHIASWHPAVALAVADWLTYVADTHDETACPAMSAAEQVARAYLGESA